MADIFLAEDMKSLLAGKRIVFIGDSNVRAMYKDWLWLMRNNSIMPERCLKSKLERSFAGDSLLSSTELHRGRDFREVREYQDKSIYVHFMFVTKCISYNVKRMFEEFKLGKKPPPDIIIFNSCLWDISRWGPDGVDMFKRNMAALMLIMHNSLPLTTLILFTTTLPVSLKMRGAFLVPDVDFLKFSIPFDVMEANQFIRALVVAHGFDVVDLHFHVRYQLHRRAKDGVHWEPIVIRHLTNLLLTHISVSLGVKLPGRARQYARMRMECVETAEWIGHSVDPKLSEPVSSLTLEDIEVSGNSSPRSSSRESCGLPAELGDMLLLGLPVDLSDLSDGLPNVPNREMGTERDTSVLTNLYEAPVESFRNPRLGMSSQVFGQNSGDMGILDNKPRQLFENQRGFMFNQNYKHNVPVMDGLYDNPIPSSSLLPRSDSMECGTMFQCRRGIPAPVYSMQSFGNPRGGSRPIMEHPYQDPVIPFGFAPPKPSYKQYRGSWTERGFEFSSPVEENQNIGPARRGQNSRPNNRGHPYEGQHFRGGECKVRLTNDQKLGPNYQAQSQGQRNRALKRGQNHQAQDREQNYKAGGRLQNDRARESNQHYQGHNSRLDYRRKVQGQKYRAQNQKQDSVKVKQNYQEVLKQPWEGRPHIGMHSSNYVDAPQPSAVQMRYKSYSQDPVPDNSRTIRKKICWP